jgi:hypothetical protein
LNINDLVYGKGPIEGVLGEIVLGRNFDTILASWGRAGFNSKMASK